MAETGETTTTTPTTTTKTVTTSTTISINMSYLIPQGILKIVEIIVCILIFSLIADSRGWGALMRVYGLGDGYYHGPTFAMAVGIIFFLTTLILLVFFLFNLAEKLGGNKIWFMIDVVLDIAAIVLFLLSFIILCVYCTATYYVAKTRITSTNNYFIAALVFCLINMVLYILSLVFAIKAGQAPMISVKA